MRYQHNVIGQGYRFIKKEGAGVTVLPEVSHCSNGRSKAFNRGR
jgi:hypothetical protein